MMLLYVMYVLQTAFPPPKGPDVLKSVAPPPPSSSSPHCGVVCDGGVVCVDTVRRNSSSVLQPISAIHPRHSVCLLLPPPPSSLLHASISWGSITIPKIENPSKNCHIVVPYL